jgi:hypothetical protein
MSNGVKFSGPAHVIFAELMGDDLTTIERILGRRVLGVRSDLHALIKQHGGYANIPPEAFPPSAPRGDRHELAAGEETQRGQKSLRRGGNPRCEQLKPPFPNQQKDSCYGKLSYSVWGR